MSSRPGIRGSLHEPPQPKSNRAREVYEVAIKAVSRGRAEKGGRSAGCCLRREFRDFSRPPSWAARRVTRCSRAYGAIFGRAAPWADLPSTAAQMGGDAGKGAQMRSASSDGSDDRCFRLPEGDRVGRRSGARLACRSGRILVLRLDGGRAEGDRHHRHIVAAAALERQLDQGLTGLADAEALQDFADFEILDMGRQAVAAEQELVAGPDLAIGEVEQRLLERADGPRDRRCAAARSPPPRR